ncbi:MAG: AraC family transcriptional regulator ligand-binding domain-containing protein [Myxococcota bacterium]
MEPRDEEDFVDLEDHVSFERVGTVGLDPIRALVDYALTQGMRRDRIENVIGMELEQMDGMNQLPAIAGPLLFRQILDAGLGSAPAIELGRSAPFSVLGGLERSLLLAPNGRQALRALALNFPVFHDRLVPEFDESARFTYFSFRYIGDEQDNGCCNEVVLAVLVRLMRSVFGEHGEPYEMRVRYTRNGERAAYDDFFGSRVSFRSSDESFGLVFRNSDMAWRQRGHDSEVFRFAMDRLSRVADRRRSANSLTDYLELVNASNMCVADGAYSVAALAAKAGLSVRTAQRLAKRNKTSLARILESARLRIVREELFRHPGTGAEVLTRLSGFSDSRALRRALKNWTGQTLSELREAHR